MPFGALIGKLDVSLVVERLVVVWLVVRQKASFFEFVAAGRSRQGDFELSYFCR